MLKRTGICVHRLSNRLTTIGMALIFLGGSAADSPGNGYLWAAAIVLVGCGFAFAGIGLGGGD